MSDDLDLDMSCIRICSECLTSKDVWTVNGFRTFSWHGCMVIIWTECEWRDEMCEE